MSWHTACWKCGPGWKEKNPHSLGNSFAFAFQVQILHGVVKSELTTPGKSRAFSCTDSTPSTASSFASPSCRCNMQIPLRVGYQPAWIEPCHPNPLHFIHHFYSPCTTSISLQLSRACRCSLSSFRFSFFSQIRFRYSGETLAAWSSIREEKRNDGTTICGMNKRESRDIQLSKGSRKTGIEKREVWLFLSARFVLLMNPRRCGWF